MDYEKLGFKCGLEIHQQLEGRKLFSNSPTIIRKDEPDYEVKRRLRASSGETGETDAAALHEMVKGKEFVYQGYNDTISLVELDEAPPRPMNEEALETCLQVCKMLNADIVDQIQVMRKIVVDGSNTSGFQRTALIGRNGYVEVDGKKIGIPSICLEEEACQVIERTDEKDVYNLSRLGIPLIEIATAPDITSAEECKAVAAKIGMILRSTGKVKRGLGSIRQDVNLSIKGGERVEIKGFQDLKSIPRVIENEVKRHQKVLKKGDMEAHVRKAEDDYSTSFLRPMPGAARMYPETDIPKIVTPDTKDIEVPKTIAERAREFEEEYGLPEGYGRQLTRADIPFGQHVKEFPNVDATLLAEFFIKVPKDIKSRENLEVNPEDHLEVLEKLNERAIPKSAIEDIIIKREKGEEVDYSDYEKVSDEELEKAVKEILEDDPDAPMGAVMGQVMKRFKGQVEGQRAKEFVQKLK